MNKINKKRITSVALAFTLAVAAPVKANFSSFDLGLNNVFAAEVKETEETLNAQKTSEQAKLEQAKQEKIRLEGLLKAEEQKITEATKKITENADNTEATKAIAEANKEIERLKPLIQAEEQKITDATRKIEEIDGKIKAIQDAKAKEKAKVELKSAIDTAKGSLSTATSDVYTQDSIDKLKAAIETAEGIYKDDTKKSTDYTTAKTNLEKVKLEKKSVKPAPTKVTLYKPTVYSDRVTGEATPYAKVELYKNGSYKGSATADRNGNYTIYNTFGTYRDGYYNGYYGYRDTVSSNPSYRYVSGYTTAYTDVVAYNNGTYLGSARSNGNGYYSINHTYVSNPSYTTVYRDGYYNGYDRYSYYYDLSDYYLVASKDGMTSDKYYLNNANTYDYGYRKDPLYNYNYAYAPRVTQAIAGTSTVKGSGVNGYATVAVYDSKGIRLGSGTAYSNGEFTISLNRDLKAGEEIKVTANYSNLRENSTTYKVAGEVKKDTYNYTVNLAIGDKIITTTKDGVTTTTTMDVEAYIKDGRTMLPIRFVAQALGYNVTWNDVTRIASFTDGKRVVIINVDSREFYVDGIKNTFSVDPEIKNGRTMLPVSEIGKALGMTTGNKGDNKNIEWDSVRREVKIQLTK